MITALLLGGILAVFVALQMVFSAMGDLADDY